MGTRALPLFFGYVGEKRYQRSSPLFYTPDLSTNYDIKQAFSFSVVCTMTTEGLLKGSLRPDDVSSRYRSHIFPVDQFF